MPDFFAPTAAELLKIGVTAFPTPGQGFALDETGRIPLSLREVIVYTATAVATSETTASTSYTDLATTGPTLTGLPPGSYVVIFGSKTFISATPNATFMAIQPNSTTPVDADSTGTSTVDGVAVARAVAITLSSGGENNTLTAKYRVGGGTGTFFRRWLIAIKYAPLTPTS